MFLLNHIIFNEKNSAGRSQTIAFTYTKGRFKKPVKSGGVSLHLIFTAFVVNYKLRKEASGLNG